MISPKRARSTLATLLDQNGAHASTQTNGEAELEAQCGHWLDQAT